MGHKTCELETLGVAYRDTVPSVSHYKEKRKTDISRWHATINATMGFWKAKPVLGKIGRGWGMGVMVREAKKAELIIESISASKYTVCVTIYITIIFGVPDILLTLASSIKVS